MILSSALSMFDVAACIYIYIYIFIYSALTFYRAQESLSDMFWTSNTVHDELQIQTMRWEDFYAACSGKFYV